MNVMYTMKDTVSANLCYKTLLSRRMSLKRLGHISSMNRKLSPHCLFEPRPVILILIMLFPIDLTLVYVVRMMKQAGEWG